MKIGSSAGPSLFIRPSYLETTDPSVITEGWTCGGTEALDVMQASSCYFAEYAAMGYLGRSEYSRKQLTLKLLKKEFSRECVEKVLDRLEQRGYLDDSRFAGAWLRNRIIHRSEGRAKLLAGLSERGVAPAVARDAADEFFASCSEDALLDRAFDKCLRLGRDRDKIIRTLMRKGFSSREIIKKLEQHSISG